MLIRLHSPRRKLLFGALCLALVAAYVYRTSRGYLAERWMQSTDPAVLERATRLEPQNAETWYRLGRVRSILIQDIPGSIPALQRATALDPRHARYWMDLALAYQYTGNAVAQRKAIETAIRLDAHDPDIAWEAGNYYLLAGDTGETLKLFGAAVEGDPIHRNFSRAILLSLRATHNDYMRVLEEVVPRDPWLYLGYADFLVGMRQYEAADQVWSRTMQMGKRVKPQFASGYLGSLVARNDSERARAAWNSLAQIDPELQPYSYSESLVINGGFEHNILNFGFGWHYTRKDEVALEIDSEAFHSGNHALLMTFGGDPVADIGLQQTVPVDGGACYELSGWMRTSELEGVSGPRLAVRELKSARALAQLPEVSGTHGWQELQQNFRTDATTHFVNLAIVRERAQTAIRGRAWADDVRLTRIAAEACR